MTGDDKSRFFMTIVSVALVGSILGAGWMGASRVYARQLSAASDITRRAKDLISADQVLHFYVTVYQRTNPALQEPPDPYHLPVIPLYRDKHIIERWSGIDTEVHIRKLASEPDLILGKFVITPDRGLIYDGMAGIVITLPPHRQRPSQSDLHPKTADSWLDGVRFSNWGRLAWVVRFEPISSTPALFETLP